MFEMKLSIKEEAACVTSFKPPSEPKKSSLPIWHARLGHIGMSKIENAVKRGMIEGVIISDAEKPDICKPCVLAKMTKVPRYRSHSSPPSEILHTIVMDTFGPVQVRTPEGHRYFHIMIDVKSRMVFVRLLRKRDEIPKIFYEFKQKYELKMGMKIKVLRFDPAGEHIGMIKDLKKIGIEYQEVNATVHEENGIAERTIRTICNGEKAMRFNAEVPDSLWGDAVLTFVYDLNRLPHSSIQNQIPYTIFFKSKPDLRNAKIFGCIAYAINHNQKRKKIDAKSIECRFVGYHENTDMEGKLGYRLRE